MGKSKLAVPDFSSLDGFDLDSLSSKSEPRSSKKAATTDGRPGLAPRSDFRPNPDQPRKHFDLEKLKSLALSMKGEGVKVALIVKSPDSNGLMEIQDGERRWRASELEGVGMLPYVIDDSYDKLTQLIVNAQREDNTADEKAQTILELQERGVKRAEIARRMGKSPAYVTELAEFAQLPAELRAIYEQERVTDVTVLNLLARMFKKNPADVLAFIESLDQEINRRTVNRFADSLRQVEASQSDGGDDGDESEAPHVPQKANRQSVEESERYKRPVIHVQWNDKAAVLLVNRRSSPGKAWIKLADGKEKEVRFSSVQNVEILDGQ